MTRDAPGGEIDAIPFTLEEGDGRQRIALPAPPHVLRRAMVAIAAGMEFRVRVAGSMVVAAIHHPSTGDIALCVQDHCPDLGPAIHAMIEGFDLEATLALVAETAGFEPAEPLGPTG